MKAIVDCDLKAYAREELRVVHAFGRILMLSLVLFATDSVSQDLQTQIEECEACHGGGTAVAQDDIPVLAGRDEADLLEALNAFNHYERHCTTTTYRHGDRPKTPLNMCNVANALSEEDIKALAEYFSSQ